MRFLVDAQLPPALARWLVGKGHEAEHLADCGLAEASDRPIWRYALDAGAVILTKGALHTHRPTTAKQGAVFFHKAAGPFILLGGGQLAQ